MIEIRNAFFVRKEEIKGVKEVFYMDKTRIEVYALGEWHETRFKSIDEVLRMLDL